MILPKLRPLPLSRTQILWKTYIQQKSNLDSLRWNGHLRLIMANSSHLIHLFEIDILTRIRSIDHSIDYSWPFYWLSLINYFKPNFILWCPTIMSSEFNKKLTFTVDHLDHIPNWLDLLCEAEAEFKIISCGLEFTFVFFLVWKCKVNWLIRTSKKCTHVISFRI